MPDHRSGRDAADGLDARQPGRGQGRQSRPSTSCPGADWYAIFKDLHAGLILDLAGQQERSAASASSAPTSSIRPRCASTQAYGSLLSRQGTKDEALKVFKAFDEALPRHPLITEAIDDVKAGKKLPLVVDTPQAGAAEVLYGLGAALGRRGGEDLGLVYLQLALYLVP